EALAELEAARGNYDEAVAVLERLAARQPENASLYGRHIGLYRVARGEVEEGLAALQALMQAEPNNPWNPYTYAEALTEVRRYQEARQVLESIPVAREPHEELDQDVVASRALVPALAARLLLRIAEEQKDVDLAFRAWRLLEKASELLRSPLDPRLGERLVLLLVEVGAFDLAREHLGRIPYEGLRQFVEGYLQWRQGERDAARGTWERLVADAAAKAQQEEVDARPWALLALGRPDEALDLLEPPGTYPIDTLLLRAVALAQRGDLDDAVATMEEALLETRVRITDWRLPIAPARLWRNFLPPEAWERLAPFFVQEPV
ncbi:MAG: tetratricopeptide repeat protein, partial [Anaerolineae bacterium]|nr:tetratricopeptide repeat protein [Anaerolineae bacterium]